MADSSINAIPMSATRPKAEPRDPPKRPETSGVTNRSADTSPLDEPAEFEADDVPSAAVPLALEARDATKMLSYVEPTVFRREISPEIRAYVEYLKEIHFTDVRYTLIDSDGERAHVRWVATMAYTLNLGSETKSGERPIDTTFELTKFEGTWYLRSAVLPKA